MRKTHLRIILVSSVLIITAILIRYYFTARSYATELTAIPEEDTLVPEPYINYIYGLPADSFLIGGGRVQTNQVISGILNKMGVSGNDINTVMEKAGRLFDVRKFKAGNNYVTLSSFDSIPRLQYFIYEKDAVNYLVLRFADSLDAWEGVKQIDTIRSTFSGSIMSSLWNTFADKGANPVMANELSEIYAWTIDFFGLQEGDSLRVVYDEYFVDSVSVGIGKIQGAWFRHMDKEFWAIPFVQDSAETFFDDEGQSLRKAFLKAPLRFSRISSRFSNSRMHPVLKIRRPHHGVDYAAPIGTPVYAIGDGFIVQTGYNGGAGNMIKIKHNSVYSTAYLHLSRYGKGIKQGVYVKQGDLIGYVGSSGLSTGPHLDFRFYKNGNPVDPLKVEAPPVDPVKSENLGDFAIQKDKVIKEVLSF